MNYKIKTLGIEFPRGRRAARSNNLSLRPLTGGRWSVVGGQYH